MPPEGLLVIPVHGIGEVEAGADIAGLIARSVEPGDVVVVAQKIVSKAEGRLVAAADREAVRTIVRREAKRVVRETPELLIVETSHGLVCANAGVDASNVPEGSVSLLPKDPDASADRIRRALEERVGGPVAVIVSDTFGRAWRIGQTNVAIGSSGISAVRDHRGHRDPSGHELAVTEIAHVDELAAAAELVMGKLDRVPVAIVRGYAWEPSSDKARSLVRPPAKDLFR